MNKPDIKPNYQPKLTIDFSHNWNKKLGCDAFTTLRLRQYGVVGDVLTLTQQFKPFGTATIIAVKVLKLSDINDYIAYLDTGYNAEECKQILMDMYKQSQINWTTQKIYFHLLKRNSNNPVTTQLCIL